MTNPTDEFFDQLSHQGHEPLVSRVSGALRFEVSHRGETEIRLLTIDRGHLTASRDADEADCVIRVDRSVLDAIITGKTNAMAAFLRGALSAEGNPEMMVIFQRLLPHSSGARRRDAVETVAGW
jgi:putative sterol carrier protein